MKKSALFATLLAVNAFYEHLLKDFATTQDFVNPYATYMASVFFFLDGDYKRAQDLFKEVAIINKNSAEFNKEFNIFENYAKSLNPQSLQKYVFVVYESGFGAGLDEFAITLPFTFDGNVVTSSLALPTLKKRTNSYEYVVANGSTQPKSKFSNFLLAHAQKSKFTTPLSNPPAKHYLKANHAPANSQPRAPLFKTHHNF